MEILNSILEILKPLIEAYAGNYGWAIQVVAIVGTFRLFFKPIMAAVEAAVAQSESKKDDEMLGKLQGNVIYKGFIFLVDMIASIKIKPKSEAQK